MYRTITVIVASIALAGCSPKQDPPGKPEASAPPTNRIAVPDTVRRNLGITFIKVERRRLAQTLRLPGHFELLATARHELRTPLGGRVTLLVKPLAEVKAGDVICRVDSPAWRQLQRDLGEIATQVRVHEAKLAAMAPLSAAHLSHEETLRDAVATLEAREKNVLETQGSVGGQARELTEARAQLAQGRADLAEAVEKRAVTDATKAELEAEVAAARDRFRLAVDAAAAVAQTTAQSLLQVPEGTTEGQVRWRTITSLDVHATTDGVVDAVPVTTGAWVDAGGLIASVSDLKQVRFRARALQGDLRVLAAGLSAQAIPAESTSSADERVAGTLLLGAHADPAQRTVELFLELSAPAAWARPGVAGFLEVTTAATGEAVLAIPMSATMPDGLERVFFRRDPKDPDKVIRLEADAGIDDGRWIEIKSGLVDGDEVVLAGVYELMLASSGSAQKGGHFHADGTYHEGEHK